MEITRDVILDLLPLYLAGEVSEDSRVLVERYLESDPELADMAKHPETAELLEDIPVSLTEEDKMEAYKEAKRLMLIRTVVLAFIISGSAITVLLVGVLAAGHFLR
jgi:anti-sigma factor RsiW